MRQCNAQTNARPSGVAPARVDQSTAQVPITTKKEPLLQPTARGLELIKSCAKFYANGVGVAKPTIQLSHPVGAALKSTRGQTDVPLTSLEIEHQHRRCHVLILIDSA